MIARTLLALSPILASALACSTLSFGQSSGQASSGQGSSGQGSSGQGSSGQSSGQASGQSPSGPSGQPPARSPGLSSEASTSARERAPGARGGRPASSSSRGTPAVAVRVHERAPSPEAYRALLTGELRQLEGDLPGAVDAVREAVVHDPDSVFLRVRLGQLHLSVGDVERSLEAARAARQLDPLDLEALRLHAASSSLSGDKDEAKELLRRALKVRPGDRPSSTMLAELLLEEGRVGEAEKVIDELMQTEPGATDGYLVLARLFVEKGERERALTYTERALDRDPGSAEALELRIDLLHAAGAFEEAVPTLRGLVRERGDTRGTRYALLVGLLVAGDTAGAEALAEVWLDEDDSEDMLTLIADAYETAGERARARGFLETGGATPRSERLAVRLARLLLDDGRPAEAAELACGLAGDGEEGWTAYLRSLCARARTEAGELAAAKEVLERALVDIGPAWRLLAELSRLARAPGTPVTPEEALSAIEEARESRPLDTDLVDVWVRALEDHHQPGRASRAVEEALRQRPHHPELLMVEARHRERLGEHHAAVAIVERLMERSERPTTDHLNFAAFTLADHQERPHDAVRWAWQAVLRDPLNGYIVDTLGWAQFAAGDHDAALATLLRADRLAPGEPEILLHLAEVYEARKERELARDLARRAKAKADALDPIRPRIERVLGRLDGR